MAPLTAPFWAEAVLRELLPRDRADDVTGDLLEAARAQPRLAASSVRRHAWYARQVVACFLRPYWVFPALLVAAMLSNDLLNTFRDVSGARRGPDLFGSMLLVVFVCAAVFGGWRTGRIRGGLAAAVGTHVCAWFTVSLWWVATTYPFSLSQQTNPYWIQAWHWSAAPGETFLHWIIWDNVGAMLLGGSALLLLSLVLGLVGGTTGSQIRRRQRVRANF